MSRVSRLLLFPIQHPIAILSIALAVALAAIISVSRIHPDASLEAMFTRHSDAGSALSHVMHDFDAVDELLVLVSMPDQKAPPNPDQLLGFAQRFEDQVKQSKSSTELVDSVIYRADSQTIEYFEKVLVPSAIFYLDDATFAAAMHRLTREQMQKQIEQDQAMMATPGPAAGALAKTFMQDPLRLREFLLDRLKEQAPFHTYQGSDAFLSPDGRNLLIRVRGRKPPDDLDYCQALVREIDGCANRANSDHLAVQLAGSYAIAADSGRAIRSDMISSVTGSIICLQILFLLAYRGAFRLFIVALAPIALGILLGFGVYAIFHTGLTPLAGVLGGILAGMAIDYSVQYLSMYESRRENGAPALTAAKEATLGVMVGALEGGGFTPSHGIPTASFSPAPGTPGEGWGGGRAVDRDSTENPHPDPPPEYRERGNANALRSRLRVTPGVTPAATAAWATSVVGFLAIAASSVRMLRDFSILGSIGLAGAFISVVMLEPMLLSRMDWRPERIARSYFRFSLAPLLRWIGNHRKLCAGASILVTLLSAVALVAWRGDLLSFESDLTVMHPRPHPALAAQDEISKRFGIAPDSIVVYLHADSDQKLVELSHDVSQRLSASGAEEAGVARTYGLATLLPDPRVAPARIAATGPVVADRVVNDFQSVMADAGFNLDAQPIKNYSTFLRVLLTQHAPPTIRDLLPYGTLARTMLPRAAFSSNTAHSSDAITVVFMRHTFSDRAYRDRAVNGVRTALDGLSGATPTGLSVIAFDTEAAVRRDLPVLACIALAAVALYLAVHFRSVTNAALALAPTIFSFLVLLAVMHLAGQKLNMINLVAVPLLIGIDVDYGIFLVSLARSKNIPARLIPSSGTPGEGQGGGRASNCYPLPSPPPEYREREKNSAAQVVKDLSPVCHAVMICALATLIGFGSLAWTSVPAIRSLGIAVAVGIGACLFSAMFLLVPIFFMLAREEASSR